MSSDSPVQWRTPDGVMRKIRLRKQQNQTHRRASLSTLSLNTSTSFENQAKKKTSAGKSQNPFAKKRPSSEFNEVTKKRILSSSEYERGVENILQQPDIFSDSNSSERPEKPAIQPPQNKMPFIFLEEDSIQGIFTSNKTHASPADHNLESTQVGSECLPMDWTIKRKARFLSTSTFGWCARIKGAENANAITQATRCHQSDINPKPNFGNASDDLQKSWRTELARCATYWQQPCIPWLTLFPRFGQSVKLHSGSTSAVPQNDDVMKSFYDAWVVSFRSAYQLTRERLCPYFYICAQQYTALFRAPSVSGEREINCVLTPATTGFRKSLQKEGIEFSHPSEHDQKQESSDEDKENLAKSSLNTPKVIENGHEHEENGEDTDDEATWDLINENIKLTGVRELARQDIQAETSSRSTVIIRGTTNTQHLFNYLINSKNSIAKSGPQAYIPPTILSPVAFQGASLQKLTVRSGIARSYSESSVANRSQFQPEAQQRQFSLDVTGPLLPHSIVGITELLRKTQGFSGFRAAFSTTMYTAPLNADFSKKSNENLDQNRTKVSAEDVLIAQNFGVSQQMGNMLKNPTGSSPICLNQVSSSNGLFFWNS